MSEIIKFTMDTPSIKYLCSKDKRLAKVIQSVGEITYMPHDNAYEQIVDSIIGQMLANKVASVLRKRLLDLCFGSVTPHSINRLTDSEIKSIGISTSKVKYIRNLTESVFNGDVSFDNLDSKSDAEIIKMLTSVQGIGNWSAKMFLIFVLNRQNILPFEDMAFLQSYSWLYKTDDLKPASVKKKCQKWAPYSSIAARYLYRALDTGLTKKDFHLFKD